YIRNSKGTMVPLQAIASLRTVTGPQVITRYNNYRSVTVNGIPAPGVASGTALAAMADISAKTLPPGFGFEWTGTAFQENRAGGTASCSGWPCCSPSSFLSASTRAG